MTVRELKRILDEIDDDSYEVFCIHECEDIVNSDKIIGALAVNELTGERILSGVYLRFGS